MNNLQVGITVLICTYNGAEKLPATLRYIINMQADFPWEVIIVNNASTDNTLEVCINLLSQSECQWRVLNYEVPGKTFAFWFGLEHARYPFVLDCDDDNHLTPEYLKKGLHILVQNSKIGALGGCGLLLPGQYVPDWFALVSKSYALGPQFLRSGRIDVEWPALYGAGCFFSKAAFDELKKRGFNSVLSCRTGDKLTSGGDTEFCLALHSLGYEIWYSDELTFYHAIPENRFTREYYLKLKEGIASSFPLLHAYRFSKYGSLAVFKMHLWLEFFKALSGYGYTGLRSLVAGNDQRWVAFKVWQKKVMSFSHNYSLTLQQYKLNRKIFQKLDR